MELSLITWLRTGSRLWEAAFLLTGWSATAALVTASYSLVISEYRRRIRLHRLRKLRSLFELRRKRGGSTNLPSHVVFGSVRPHANMDKVGGLYLQGDRSNSGFRESVPE